MKKRIIALLLLIILCLSCTACNLDLDKQVQRYNLNRMINNWK